MAGGSGLKARQFYLLLCFSAHHTPGFMWWHQLLLLASVSSPPSLFLMSKVWRDQSLVAGSSLCKISALGSRPTPWFHLHLCNELQSQSRLDPGRLHLGISWMTWVEPSTSILIPDLSLPWNPPLHCLPLIAYHKSLGDVHKLSQHKSFQRLFWLLSLPTLSFGHSCLDHSAFSPELLGRCPRPVHPPLGIGVVIWTCGRVTSLLS